MWGEKKPAEWYIKKEDGKEGEIYILDSLLVEDSHDCSPCIRTEIGTGGEKVGSMEGVMPQVHCASFHQPVNKWANVHAAAPSL